MKDRSIKPIISVLMPSLNVSGYIEESIKSVLSQSLDSIEIICIDAGSTDGTIEIIKNLANSDHRIRLINSDVKSYGKQMNMGLDEAEGKYIGIVETDDYVEQDMFETLYQLASETKSDVAKGTYRLVFEDDRKNSCGWIADFIPGYIREGNAFDPGDCMDVHSWDRFIWNGIYRREFIMEKGIRFNETPGAAFQDISFQQIVLNEANRIVYTRKPVYDYRSVRPGASSLNKNSIKYLFNEYNRIFEYKNLKPERIQAIQSRMLWAFVYEYEKALLIAGYDKSKLVYPDEIRWFLDKAKDIYRSCLFSRNLLSDHYESKAGRLLNYEDAFLEEAKKGLCLLRDWLGGFRNKLNDRRVVVYGCGNYGRAVIMFLARNGIIPVSIADGSSGLIGESLFGYNIQSPEKAVLQYPDAIFITASRDSTSMRSVLNENGVDADQIYDMDVPGLYSAMCLIPYPIPDEMY